MKKAFNNFIYYLSNTDSQVISQFPPKIRVIPHLIGVSVLLAALVSTVSVGYFLSGVFYNNDWKVLIIILGCILYFFIIAMLDKGLFLAQTSKALLIRAVIIMGIASVTSVPFKLSLLDSKVATEMNNQHKKKETKAYSQVADLQANHNVGKEQYQRKLDAIAAEKNRMLRLRDAEAGGIKVSNRNTGVTGRGPKWRHYNRQVQILERRVQEVKSDRDKARDDFVRDLTKAENLFNKAKPEQDVSFISRYIAYKQVMANAEKHERLAIKEFNAGIYLLFIFLEMSPIFLKLLLGKSNMIALQIEQDMAFEERGLNRRRAYLNELLEISAPEEIDPEDREPYKLRQKMNEIDKTLANGRDNYSSINSHTQF